MPLDLFYLRQPVFVSYVTQGLPPWKSLQRVIWLHAASEESVPRAEMANVVAARPRIVKRMEDCIFARKWVVVFVIVGREEY